jgi:preprotein translocase subunit SecG
MDLTDFLDIVVEILETIFMGNEMVLTFLNDNDFLGFSLLIWLYVFIIISFITNIINSLSSDDADMKIGGSD